MKNLQTLRERLRAISDHAAAARVTGSLFSRSKDLPFWKYVKLIRPEDLQHWDTLKEYSQHDSITFAHYWEGVKKVLALEKQLRKTLEQSERLEQLDTEKPVEYDTVEIVVPPSLFRRIKRVPLPSPLHEQTSAETWKGTIEGDHLVVKGKWRRQRIYVKRLCPSRILHRQEIETLKEWLTDRPAEEMELMNQLINSPFTRPVLFISHRWKGIEHPDPEGIQLQKLRSLQHCYLVYDFCSFPQNIRNTEEKARLREVLVHMNYLIRNVVILDSPDYLDRGWCIYEYILASLKQATICDEIADPGFITLRNFKATQPPPTPMERLMRGSGLESEMQNSINEGILHSVNQVLPLFARSAFTVPEDRQIVKELLVSELLNALPARKEYVPYVGEWNNIPWTREELNDAFENELKWEPLQTFHAFRPYSLKVPATLQEAMDNRYRLDRHVHTHQLSFMELTNWFGK